MVKRRPNYAACLTALAVLVPWTFLAGWAIARLIAWWFE